MTWGDAAAIIGVEVLLLVLLACLAIWLHRD